MFKRQIKDLFLTNSNLKKYFEYYYIIDFFLSEEKINKIKKDLNWEEEVLKLELMNISECYYPNYFEDEKLRYQMINIYITDSYQFGFFKLTLLEPNEINFIHCEHPRLLIDTYNEDKLKNLQFKADYEKLENLKQNNLCDSKLLKHYDKSNELKIKIKNLKRNLINLEENLKRL